MESMGRLFSKLLIALCFVIFVSQVNVVAIASAQTFSPQGFESERDAMLRALSRPVMDCIQRYGTGAQGANADSPMFHGCWDWHSAVHAAWALYSIYRHTGDPQFLQAVEAQVKPELMNAELNYMMTRLVNNSSEISYGNSWFLALAREREMTTGQTDMRPLAEWAANRIRTVISGLTLTTARTRTLNNNYNNLSWALIHLDLWAKFTNNADLLQFTRNAATMYLFDPVLDGTTSQACPITNDTGAASNFFSPCILRLAAVAKIFGAEQADWIRQRLVDSVYVEPIIVAANDISHVNGDNWSRTFGLWWIYQVTNQPTVRANALRILVEHFAQPTHWDISAAYDVSHWVAQYAVRMIDASYEANLPDTTAHLPLQLALGDAWALGSSAPLPASTGYVSVLGQKLKDKYGSDVRLVDIGKVTGTTTIANLAALRLPYSLDLLDAYQDETNPSIRDPLLITLHTGFDVKFVTPTTVTQCGTTPPDQCTALQNFLATQATNAAAAAANDWASVRGNLQSILSQLRIMAPHARIVIGTYDNPYRSCNLPATAKAQTQTLVDQYLEGGGSFAVGLNDVIRQTAAANDVAVAEVYGSLADADWTIDCFNPNASGHAKIAQAFDYAMACNDLVAGRTAIGARRGNPRYDPRADIDGNGVIDIMDVSAMSRHLPAGTVCH
jgi:lysophospholipase L1-like esterase